MGDFLYDWKHAISRDNTTSRGFYIFLTAVMIISLIAGIGALVMTIINFDTLETWKKIAGFATPVVLGAIIVLIVKKCRV